MGQDREVFYSYAYIRENEDVILYHAFAGIHNGFYIDVGACSPIEGSVTKALYDMGWHGINIEPQEGLFAQLQKTRPRDVNLNVGVGDRDGEMVLYGQGALATLNKEINNGNQMNQCDDDVQSLVPVCTLKKVCDSYLPHTAGHSIHFCKVDVEGFERQALSGFDFQRYRPWAFVVESTMPNSDIPSYDEWEPILLDNGYEFVASYSSSRYYVERGRSDIGARLREITSLDEIVRRYTVFHVDVRSLERCAECLMTSHLYIDAGDGFTEDRKLSVTQRNPQKDGVISVRYDLAGFEHIKALRFDPIEGRYCEVEILSAETKGGCATLQPQTAVRIGNKDCFLTTDPQYVCLSCSEYLNICMKVHLLSAYDAEQMIREYVNKTSLQVNKLEALQEQQLERLEWQEGQIARQGALLAKCNDIIGERDRAMQQQSERIEWQEGQIARQGALLAKCNDIIGERDRTMQQQSERIEWQESQSIRQEALIIDLNNRISERDELLEHQKSRLDDQAARIQQEQIQIDQLHRSMSWRITAPFRAVVRLIRDLMGR